MEKKLKRHFPFYFVFSMLLLLSLGCKRKLSPIPAKKLVSGFIQQTDSLVGYGYVNLQQFFDKAVLHQMDNYGQIAEQIVTSIKEKVDISKKTFVVFTGNPSSTSLLPTNTYLVLTINDKKQFLSVFKGLGYKFTNVNDLLLASDNTTAIGIKNNIAVLLLGNNLPQLSLEEKIKHVFNSPIDKTNSNIEKWLHQNPTLAFALNVNDFLVDKLAQKSGLSSSILSILPPFQKSNVLLFTTQFYDGKVQFNIDFSQLEKNIKELQILAPPGTDSLFSFLGKENPALALSLHLQPKKVTHLLNKLSDNGSLSFLRKWGIWGLTAEGLANGKISNILKGNLALAIPEKQLENKRVAVGLGKQQQNCVDFIHTMADADSLKSVGASTFKYHHATIQLTKNGNLIYQKQPSLSPFEQGKPTLPIANDLFESYPLSLYIKGDYVQQKIITDTTIHNFTSSIDYVFVHADNSIISATLSLKNKQEHSLHQLAAFAFDYFVKHPPKIAF